MATSGTAAYGTLLKMGDGGTPETFATVAEVTKLDGIKLKLNTDDATSHDSSGWTEVIPTTMDGGEPSFEINWLPASATHSESAGVLAAMLNRTRKNWQLVLPSSAKTFAFAAYVTGFEASPDPTAKLAAKITLKISGAVSVS